MKFDDLDKKMRCYETAHDRFVPPGMYMVARIDGRSFTKLTKEVHKFNAPFDEKFRDMMVETVKHLMNCGFNIIYGYTQSDEISLLFHPEERLFGRKTRKYISVLAGEASARFSSLLGDVAAFDCRISELPEENMVEDYFRWRNEDAHRNALNAHCYWRLRQDGYSANQATAAIEGKSVAAKSELLSKYGIDFNNLPSWPKRGIGFYWENAMKEGFNPVSNESVWVEKRVIKVDMELPVGAEYANLINSIINQHKSIVGTKE